MDDPLELISVDPEICHGHPCIKGTRVMVTVVLDALAAGVAVDEIVQHYPTLTAEAVQAALAHGAWLAKQGDPPTHAQHVRFKLDENITVTASDPLVALGRDVDVFHAAAGEERALLTL